MERLRDEGAGGGNRGDYSFQALQDMSSHSVSALAAATAAPKFSAQTIPNSELVRRQPAPRSPFAGAGGSRSVGNPATAIPSIANASPGSAGRTAVPMQHHMVGPTAASSQARNAGATDAGGNTLYVHQVLQQIQHNPDPRLIENLAEILHRSKVGALEHEAQAQYANDSRSMEEGYKALPLEERQSYQREARNVLSRVEQGSESMVQRLREEFTLAQMAQVTSSANAVEADHRLAELHSEAQDGTQRRCQPTLNTGNGIAPRNS